MTGAELGSRLHSYAANLRPITKLGITDTTRGCMEAHSQTFHAEEYKQLRAEVTGLLSRIELLFRYSLIVVATVFAWLLVNSMSVSEAVGTCVKLPKPVLYFGWLIPPMFVVCAGLMARVASIRVSQIGEYLMTLENALGGVGLGWEKFLATKNSILTDTTTRLWWLLFSLAIAASCVGLWSVVFAANACPAAK